MKDTTEQRIEALAEAFWVLPRIAPDGSSECPSAEEAYFRKEKAAYDLSEHLKGLRELRTYYRDQLHKSSGDEAKRNRAMLHTLCQDITTCEQALARAATKKFPREPRGPSGQRVGERPPSTRELLSNEHKVRHLMEGK